MTITKQIPLYDTIRIQKSLPDRIIIPGPEVIESGFCIVDITSVTEGLDRTQSRSEGTGGGKDSAPGVVNVSDHLSSAAVDQPDHVALEAILVGILRAVVVHDGRAVLGIVEEVQRVAALGQMDNVLAVQGVVRHRAAHCLSDPQPIRVVEESGGSVGLGHLLELAALLPSVRPGAVIGGIANDVVGNGSAVIGGHLVLPVGIAIGISNGLEHGAQGAGGVGIALLVQEVAAPVVFVGPGGAGGAGGGVVLVVHAGQLAQGVVGVFGILGVPLHGGDIAHVVVGVGEGFAGLGDLGNQGGGAVVPVAAGNEAVRAAVAVAAHLYHALGDPAQQIVGQHGLVAGVAVAQGLGAVLGVVGEGGLVLGVVGSYPLGKGLQVALHRVIAHFAGVQVAAGLGLGDPAGAVRQVVLAVLLTFQRETLKTGRLAPGVVFVCEARRGFGVPLHLLEPVEIVVGVVDGIPIPVGELADHAPVYAAAQVGGGAQGLAAHLRLCLPAQGVIDEIVGHVAGVAGGVVLYRGQQIFGVVGVLGLVGIAGYGGGHLGDAAHGIVGVVHLLAVGIGDGGNRAFVSVGDRGDRLVARIRPGGNIVPAGIRRFRADEFRRIGVRILDIRLCGAAITIIRVCRYRAKGGDDFYVCAENRSLCF